MKNILYILILTALVALNCVGCKEDENIGEHMQVTLHIDVTLPIDQENQTRAAGDPGLAEFFERPRYLSLFLAAGNPTTPDQNRVYYFNIPCQQSDWTRSSDSLVFRGRFSQLINWDTDPVVALTNSIPLRAYMVASFDAYITNPIIQVNNYRKVINSGFSESSLLDMQFYATSAQNNYEGMSLRDIYSTPYNLSSQDYTPISATDRTGYYGTVKDIVASGDAGVIYMADTLYHVAAKVDFRWNTVTPSQENVMVSALLNNAPDRGYLFRPAEKVSEAGSYSKVLLRGGEVTADDLNRNHEARYADATEVNPGIQWSGRAYTYILQPGELDFTVTTSLGGSTRATAQPPSDNGNTNRIFAAWYLLPFSIRAVE